MVEWSKIRTLQLERIGNADRRQRDRTMKRGKKMWLIPAIFACAAIMILVFLTLRMPTWIMTGNRQTLEEAFRWQTEHYDTSFYKGLNKNDYTVKATEDYLLHVEFLKREPGAQFKIRHFISWIHRQPDRFAEICSPVFEPRL